jgi:hypothetical protein
MTTCLLLPHPSLPQVRMRKKKVMSVLLKKTAEAEEEEQEEDDDPGFPDESFPTPETSPIADARPSLPSTAMRCQALLLRA